MFTIALFFGFGFGLEGIEDGKVYVGIYTPTVEYGYVITSEQVYLDTILEKNQKNLHEGVDGLPILDIIRA